MTRGGHILALFQKDITKPPYRQETAYYVDDYSKDGLKLLELFNEVAKLLNLKSCFLSADAFVGKDNKPYIIDISPRLTGNNVLQLICYLGNNPLAVYKRCVVDKKELVLNKTIKPACVRFFDFDKEIVYGRNQEQAKENDFGKLSAVFNEQEQKLVLDYENNLVVGQSYGTMTCGHDIYRGFIFVSCDNLAQAKELSRRYVKSLEHGN